MAGLSFNLLEEQGIIVFNGNRLAIDLKTLSTFSSAELSANVDMALQDLEGFSNNDLDNLKTLIEGHVNAYKKHGSDYLKGYGGAAVQSVNTGLDDEGHSILLTKLALFDSSNLKFENFYAISFGYKNGNHADRRLKLDFNENEEAFLREFIYEHEVGHLLEDLLEPGSDFRSAALLLQEYPDNEDLRNVLVALADIRMAQSLLSEDNRIINKYGISNHEAFMYALSLPPSQLENMSQDDILEMARMIDEQAQSLKYWNNPDPSYTEPAFRVRNALREQLGEDDLSAPTQRDLINARNAAEDLMTTGKFEANSAEMQILESFVDSTDRMIDRSKGAEQQLKIDYQPVPDYSLK